ncbi:peptidyl-prolyl cis-trans isomerase-like [Acrasis kona]|uniref:Peptidyl-prolyl cis-trans isomerase-like n=1 Tax=Acrasis kona TaxID=1008807 RepID=A0AAW2ZGG0_9EUKA
MSLGEKEKLRGNQTASEELCPSITVLFRCNPFKMMPNLLPFVHQHHCNPITGEPMEAKDIIKLNWSRDAEGKIHCPMTYKVFNDHTHIVAIKTTGNVYSHDAVQNLNIKIKNWKDLLTDEKFTRSDIITIQDPNNITTKDMSQFHHLKNNLKVITDANSDPLDNINSTASTKKIIEELRQKDAQRRSQGEVNKIIYESDVRAPNTKSSALTSSVMNVLDKDRPEDVKQVRDEQFKSLQYSRMRRQHKGVNAYVTLHTSLGDLNFELYPYCAPKTCDNFITLCERKFYDGVQFHRLIKKFMVQGGDPTGTGRGGESIWKKDFEDEFHQKLKHDGPGVLAMANRGKNTNTSQFYITFAKCEQLDNKHTVFGRLVGGSDVLQSIELVETEGNDRPAQPITINSTTVLKNPYKEDEEEELKRTGEIPVEKPEMGKWFSNPIQATSGGIGKYIKKRPTTHTDQEQEAKKQKLNP